MERYRGQSNPFLCVLHPEKNPSAALFRNKKGEIIYMDFHKKEGFPTYTIQEVYLKRRKERLSKTIGIGEANKQLVREMNYWTPRAVHFYYFWNSLRSNLDFLHPDFLKVADVLMDLGIMEARVNNNSFLASCRFVGKNSGLHFSDANRAVNYLCCLGLIIKGEDKVLSGQKTTYKYTINEKININDISSIFYRLKELGVTNPRSFTLEKETLATGTTIRRRKHLNRIPIKLKQDDLLVDERGYLVKC